MAIKTMRPVILETIFQTSLFVEVSGKTRLGLNDLASSKSIEAYERMMTTSPTAAFRAAGPFRQIIPVPRPPLII